jgi:Icc-related predicted phosphoesterase
VVAVKGEEQDHRLLEEGFPPAPSNRCPYRTMKIQILSDLHFERCDRIEPASIEERIPPPIGDVLVLAGDIHLASRGMVYYGASGIPVIYVAGNHEFYRRQISRVNKELKGCGSLMDIHVLNESGLVIDGVRFLGTTLWTDFALYPGREIESMDAARNSLDDFSKIRTPKGIFTPEDSVTLHRVALQWLGEELAKPFDGPTVVVTHHAPSAKSVSPRYANSPTSPAYASELSELAGKATLWVHGHCHTSSDYNWKGTRVVANPRGYPLTRLSPIQWENPNFDPALCVEI